MRHCRLVALCARHSELITLRIVDIVKIVTHFDIARQIGVCEELEYFIKDGFRLIICLSRLRDVYLSLWKGAGYECCDNAEVVCTTAECEVEIRI